MGHVGALFGMGLASSQMRWWSPPSPPDMQANICAQTSQDSEKEFHSCAHLRLGCLALTPSPLHGMEAEGRGALPAHSVEWEAWLRSGMVEEESPQMPAEPLALGALAQGKEGLPMDILWAAPRGLCWGSGQHVAC